MKKYFSILAWCLLPLLLSSCRSTRSMQRELNELRGDLYYELTSREYTGEVKHKVYLDFIDYSNTDYYTTIRRQGGFFVPLLVYNFQKDKFKTRLGEHSLSQLYREFLTEALLTECNSSTCFQLEDNQDGSIPPDSVYRLEVKITKNETTGGVVLREHSLIWFDDEYLTMPSCRPRPSQTSLAIHIRLSHRGECLLEKDYHVEHKQSRHQRAYPDSYGANQACMDDMAESLSLATRQIVEEISQELHLLMTMQ